MTRMMMIDNHRPCLRSCCWQWSLRKSAKMRIVERGIVAGGSPGFRADRDDDHDDDHDGGWWKKHCLTKWILLIKECDFCYCYHHRGHGGHHPGGHQGRRKRSQHHKQATSWGHFPSPFWDQLLFWRFKSFFCNLPSIWYQLSTSHISSALVYILNHLAIL